MVTPSRRRRLAQKTVIDKDISIRLSCELLSISETCYRYKPKLSDENTVIADWLLRLAQNRRNWGFWFVFSVPAECEGICMESQTSLSYLSGTRAQYANQT